MATLHALGAFGSFPSKLKVSKGAGATSLDRAHSRKLRLSVIRRIAPIDPFGSAGQATNRVLPTSPETDSFRRHGRARNGAHLCQTIPRESRRLLTPKKCAAYRRRIPRQPRRLYATFLVIILVVLVELARILVKEKMYEVMSGRFDMLRSSKMIDSEE
ncbi:hypothetical protein BCR44DRAFT_33881 [Catenaria anguillulae PL171]|uniref:Uncharacterized protein n=1 Tax=Catenaria anguillulae PL171 TaxID=765915 RepID=A0A1Y2HN52_9FUNG|nr:hypothetical protein BCR44DRAFT_33881 [Catenaria anguillulae PL171]